MFHSSGITVFLLGLICLGSGLPVKAQNDLPTPSANLQVIKNGSLVIAMDTNNQKLPGYFNMKAYGLVNELLQNEIPVRWAIRSGKSRTLAGSIDFSGNVTRVFPDTTNLGVISFRCGAFIVDSAWVALARPVIAAFGNSVQIYRINTNLSIDIRYTLCHKPRILLLNSSGYDTSAVKALQEAAIHPSSYQLQLPKGSPFNPNGNWSLLSETEWNTSDTAAINPVLRYSLERGANLIMNCISLKSVENATFTMTTAGVDTMFTVWAGPTFNNHDLPVAQFQGNIITPYGDCKLWKEKPGSVFRPNTYDIMRGTSGSQLRAMMGMKMRTNTLKGGNLFYVGGHDFFFWTAPGSIHDNARINGRKIFMNSIFIPVSDSIEGISFKTDLALSKYIQPGLAVKNEPFQVTIIARNSGPGRSKSPFIHAPLPTGLLYASHTTTSGNFNPITGVWSLDSLQKNEADTLFLTVIIDRVGTITYSSTGSGSSYEEDISNNSASVTIYGVSRPLALNDTLSFSAPLFQDFNVRLNDSDEDGGPYSTVAILAGPASGTATLINGDSIRYTIAAGFTGKDSILYLTCDNYNLCDTAWLYIVVSSPLPVTLVNFSGQREENAVFLNWFTLNEKDNDFFTVERSTDGYHFEQRGKVKGKGTTHFASAYEFRDSESESPVLYYRLIQSDFDGTTAASNVIALPKRENSAFNVEIYPNPGDGSFQVIRAEGVSGTLSMTVSDLGGRRISQKTWDPDRSGFVIDYFTDIDRLAPGCYLVQFNSATRARTLKLVIR